MQALQTLQQATHRLGRTGYIEIARKRIGAPNGEPADYLVIARGFYDQHGGKRWTRFVTLPDEPEARAWLARQLLEL